MVEQMDQVDLNLYEVQNLRVPSKVVDKNELQQHSSQVDSHAVQDSMQS